jgi:oligosaccharyl transferase (archaeosortase A-associated)
MHPRLRVRQHVIDVAFVVVAMLLGLGLRVVPAAPQVFRGDRVLFAGNDPWIHMRNVDVAVAQFPSPLWFDPYRLAVEGQWAEAPLMDLTVAAIALLWGGGHPSPHVVDLAGAWFPAIAGALVVIPIFFIARRLIGCSTARLATLLVAVLPGQLFQRSLIGQTDHHVVEALLTACVMLFLLRALSDDGGMRVGDAVVAGCFLGAYLLAWSSGSFLVLILLIGMLLVIAFAIFWQTNPAPAARALAIAFAIAAIVSCPVALRLPSMHLVIPLLLGSAAGLLFFSDAIPRLQSRTISPLRIFGTLGLATTLLAGMIVVVFGLGGDVVSYAGRFTPSAGARTVAEIQPLLQINHRFSLLPLWLELTTSSFLALAGLFFLGRSAWRERSSSKLLFLFWSVAILAATLVQIRFAYYFALAAAVLAAAAAVQLSAPLHRGFASVAMALIVIYPNIFPAMAVAASPNYGPSPGWVETMEWMRANTPEPFADSSAYHTSFTSAAKAPRPSYDVMVWWDFGYWVTRIGRRAPVSNPTQANARVAAQFYLATDEAAARRMLVAGKTKYVIVDDSTPVLVATSGLPQASQLTAMARWAEVDPGRFYELHTVRDREGVVRPVFVYYPDYYRTMAIHLLVYGGESWTPSQSSWAIRSLPSTFNGRPAREITDLRSFADYESAEAWVRRDPVHWRLGGFETSASCVPLPRLSFVHLVKRSKDGRVSIFELR